MRNFVTDVITIRKPFDPILANVPGCRIDFFPWKKAHTRNGGQTVAIHNRIPEQNTFTIAVSTLKKTTAYASEIDLKMSGWVDWT